MKVLIRNSSNRNSINEEKNDYANFSHTRIITLFQIPQYEHLQILICNGNSLTTLAGVEHIKNLWKLDVGNNQIRSLQHLSRFIALGSLILSNNNLSWIELQHIRHMFILDLKIDGNPILDSDPNYRQHVLDCLPRIWMLDGIFVSTNERNQVDEFFTQSSLTQKPVRRKLAKDIFMPTNLKDRSVNGLFGTKATELFAKFPMNCFINSELDRKRIKHLASSAQDLLLTEMKHEEKTKHDDFLNENRHNLYHLIDLRQTHIEQFNMFLILLITDMLYGIPDQLLDNVLDVTRIKTIGNVNVSHIFSSSEQLKCTIASLIHAGARLDRDENHPSAFYEKLFNSLSIVITNQIRQISSPNPNHIQPYTGLVYEAKSMVCLEVMQVLVMCPIFYALIDNSNVNAIFRQAFDRSPAFTSIKDVLESFNTEQKTPEEQKDLLCPILGNILKMTIRTLSNKRTKKTIDLLPTGYEPTPSEVDTPNRQTNVSPKPYQRSNAGRLPAIGDRILTAPQCSGRIVTLPDAEIAMIQLDNVLAINGAMISNGTLTDHTTYVNMNSFEWDIQHEYWKPKNASGDKITLQMTTIRSETPKSVPPPPLVPRSMTPKMQESGEKGRVTPKLFEMNLQRSATPTIEATRETISSTPPHVILSLQSNFIDEPEHLPKSPPPTPPPIIERKSMTSDETFPERPMSVRIIKQKQEQHPKNFSHGESISRAPVLIESMLLLMPDQSQAPIVSYEQPVNSSLLINHDYEPARNFSYQENSLAANTYRRSTATHRVHVPVHDASHWFDGPDMKNERTGRMEKVVASLVRRSYRPATNYAMPRVPTLTSPSSRDHAHYKGARPGSFQDFRIESHRMTPTPIGLSRQPLFAKNRYTPSLRSFDFTRSHTMNSHVYRVKSMLNPPCTTPS